jgi:hypothetical protein
MHVIRQYDPSVDVKRPGLPHLSNRRTKQVNVADQFVIGIPLQEIDSKEIATTWNATTAVVGKGALLRINVRGRSYYILRGLGSPGTSFSAATTAPHAFTPRKTTGTLTKLAQKLGCAVHAYVLMTNHVHLLLTPEQAESAAYRALFKALLDKA